MSIVHRRARRAPALVVALVSGLSTLAASTPPAAAAGSNTLTVKAGEYAYSLEGKPKSGWVQIDFDNGGVEYHMMDLVKLKPGATASQLEKVALSDDEKAVKKVIAGPVGPFPGVLGPNKKMSMYTKLGAGHYGILCYIPAPDGEPHVAHGMVKTFDVSSAKSGLTPPTDGLVDITITDSAVTLPSTGVPAKGTAKIVNKGTGARDLVLAQLLGNSTVPQAKAYFDQFLESGAPAGAPPAVLAAGVIAIPKGATAYLVLELDKGRYVFANSESESDNDPNESIAEFEVK